LVDIVDADMVDTPERPLSNIDDTSNELVWIDVTCMVDPVILDTLTNWDVTVVPSNELV